MYIYICIYKNVFISTVFLQKFSIKKNWQTIEVVQLRLYKDVKMLIIVLFLFQINIII